MAQNKPRYVPTFRAPTAYEEEMLRAQRQQQLAEMLRQQAEVPDQEYTFQGFRAMPSIAGGLAKVLKSYGARKAEEQADEAARAAREADIAGTEQVMRSLAPQARVAAPTAAEIAGSVGMPQISEEGAVSYGPTAQPQTRTEMVGPTAQERRDLLTQTMVRGTPTAKQLAQFLAAQEPKTAEFGTNVQYDDQNRAYVVNKAGEIRYLDGVRKPAEAPAAVTPVTIRKGNKDVVIDARTGKELGAAPVTPRDEPLTSVIGPDGKPILMRRSQAEGKQPYFATMAGGTQLTGDDKVDRRQFRAKRQELQNAYNSVLGFVKELKNTPKEESLFGEKAGRLASNYKLALGAVRVLQNTGVLNVGELPFIEDTLRDPQSISQLFNPASRATIGGQVESILDLLEQQSSVNDEIYGYDVTPLKGRELRGEKIPAAAVKAGLTQADWDAATEEEKSAWR